MCYTIENIRRKDNMNTQINTLQYYNENAKSFIDNTIAVNFKYTQDKFLHYLAPSAYILDFGCGSGRDTKAFLEQGYQVDAIDGSEEFCKFASEFTGIQVKHMYFQELSDVEKYDGIWACSSILHLPVEELKEILIKIARALKSEGVLYTSFKYGDFEGIRNGRYFTYMTIDKFNQLLTELNVFKLEEHWETKDVRPGREDEEWLNLILRKK